MNREEILNKVQQIFKDNFDNEELTVSEQTSSSDIEEWDSFEQINLLVTIEGAFKIKFDITEVSEIKCVGDIIGFIEKKI
jgi:acyl carrier protein